MNVIVHCNQCQAMDFFVFAKKTKNWSKTNSDLCQYEINLWFSMALQLGHWWITWGNIGCLFGLTFSCKME